MAETLPALPLDVMEIGERAAQFARSSRASATERAYQGASRFGNPKATRLGALNQRPQTTRLSWGFAFQLARSLQEHWAAAPS